MKSSIRTAGFDQAGMHAGAFARLSDRWIYVFMAGLVRRDRHGRLHPDFDPSFRCRRGWPAPGSFTRSPRPRDTYGVLVAAVSGTGNTHGDGAQRASQETRPHGGLARTRYGGGHDRHC